MTAQVLTQIAAHPRCNDLARLVRDCLFDVADPSGLAEIAASRSQAAGISRSDAELSLGNVLDVLAAPASDPSSSALLGGLLAYSLALEPPAAGSESDVAAKLVQLAGSTGIDAFVFLDEAMGERARVIWDAVADLVRQQESRPGLGLANAVVAAAALAGSRSDAAVKQVHALRSVVSAPLVASILRERAGDASAPTSLSGEIAPRPRGPVATFFLGLIGWLLLSHAARLVGRFALQYRRPAEVTITPQGVRVRSKTTLLGKTVRETETLIPVDGLARATREVRFPRLGTYAGLAALAIGSYVGVSWFIDGIRTASFSLATVGLLVVIAGVALDFALVSFLPGRKGQCRLVLVPRKGAATCVGWVDAAEADALLKGLSKR